MIPYSTKVYIERLFLLFIFLLLVEGILRKWVLPQNIGFIFMVIRDPLIVLILIKGIKYNLMREPLIKLMIFLSFISFVTTLIFGHHNIFVAIYGIRISVLYFPAMYVIGNTITLDFIDKIGKVFLYLFPFIVLITILQFFSPPGAMINAGKGFAIDSDISAGELHMKASGIFTSVVGLTDYYILVLVYIIYFYRIGVQSNLINNTYLWICVIFYVISIPVSVSRTHLFFTIITLSFYCLLLKRKNIYRIILFAFLFCLSFKLLQYIPFFETSISVFNQRFVEANKSEGGAANSIMTRTLGYALNVLNTDLPFWGYGEGYCTNVGIKIIHGVVGVGNMSDPIVVKRLEDSEMEWARLITENGPILGILFVILRISIAFKMFKLSINKLFEKNYLCWLFLPPAFIFIAFLPLKVPTNLAFMLIAGVLAIASCRINMVSLK